MGSSISVVINTLNEEDNIERAVKSVKWADEILVCDMHSEDKTVEIAKKLGAKIITHERTGYVEPARNFAIAKASGDWILILDADEEIPSSLVDKLKEITESGQENVVHIPRKNFIFGKWMKASFWWPDYNIRFFKEGTVTWSDKIHSKPQTQGVGISLPAEESLAIIHYNYSSISQFVMRMNRYSDVQAKELHEEGVKFFWQDLISKPLSEFLSRFFAHRGFEDGLHGLALSLLQAVSFLLVYLKLWEMEKFKEEKISVPEVQKVVAQAGGEIRYWFNFTALSKNPLKRFAQKIGNRI